MDHGVLFHYPFVEEWRTNSSTSAPSAARRLRVFSGQGTGTHFHAGGTRWLRIVLRFR